MCEIERHNIQRDKCNYLQIPRLHSCPTSIYYPINLYLKYCSVQMFADDRQLYLSFPDSEWATGEFALNLFGKDQNSKINLKEVQLITCHSVENVGPI